MQTYLDFEKNIAELEGKMEELRHLSDVGDIKIADEMLRTERAAGTVRVATGYDVHALGPGDAVILCGVSIPHDRTLVGHSDADVGLHALTDALLDELAGFEEKITARGHDIYAAASGEHDDLVLAVALAVWAAECAGIARTRAVVSAGG